MTAILRLTKNTGLGHQPSEIVIYPSARPAPAAAGFSFGGAVARRGRPKKPGARYACGKLREPRDHGSEYALAQRAAIVGIERAADPLASEALGQLLLRQEIDRAEYEAGTIFAATRAIAYGSPWTPSQISRLVHDTCGGDWVWSEVEDQESRHAKAERRLREAVGYILIAGRRPLDVLENVAVLGHSICGPHAYLDRRAYEALKTALDRLIRLWKIPR